MYQIVTCAPADILTLHLPVYHPQLGYLEQLADNRPFNDGVPSGDAHRLCTGLSTQGAD